MCLPPLFPRLRSATQSSTLLSLPTSKASSTFGRRTKGACHVCPLRLPALCLVDGLVPSTVLMLLRHFYRYGYPKQLKFKSYLDTDLFSFVQVRGVLCRGLPNLAHSLLRHAPVEQSDCTANWLLLCGQCVCWSACTIYRPKQRRGASAFHQTGNFWPPWRLTGRCANVHTVPLGAAISHTLHPSRSSSTSSSSVADSKPNGWLCHTDCRCRGTILTVFAIIAHAGACLQSGDRQIVPGVR